MLLSVILAVAAACSNALANVAQREANRREEGVPTLSLRLVWDLVHRPVWLAGLGFVVLSFVLQAAALRFGSLALVEPLIVVELPLTFVAASVFLHAPMGRREWTAAGVMTLGLAAMIGFLDPHGGLAGNLPAGRWAFGLSVSIGVVLVLVALGRRTRGAARAALYGAAAGIEFGLTAAIMKAATVNLSAGAAAVLTAWSTYAMVAAGIGAMFLLQNALQAGRLVAAQPGITLADPCVAIVWGVVAFHERTSGGPLLVLSGLGALLLVAGAWLLSRSPLLEEQRPEPAEAGAHR